MARMGSRVGAIPVGALQGEFLIPAYQRGYRWTSLEVTQLLNDIVEHRRHRGPEAVYYLQPIVVKARHAQQSDMPNRSLLCGIERAPLTVEPNPLWEVIDGQQRLTTLFLILKFLTQSGQTGKHAEPGFTLDYETRTALRGILDNPECTQEAANIDEEHVIGAYCAIRRWFSDHNSAAPDVFDALENQVRIIWYELSDGADPIAAFRRLNSGRIPLTDAELLKSLLLSTIDAAEEGGQALAYQVASEWDALEQELRDPAKWAFIAGTETTPTRISRIFELLVDLKADKGPSSAGHRVFEGLRHQVSGDWRQFWNDVRSLHATLMGWYNHPELYHWIGFLRFCSNPTDWTLLLTQGRARSKTDFRQWVRGQVRKTLGLTPSKLRDLHYGEKSKVQDALLLMNIEVTRKSLAGRGRFPFELYMAGKWSLEHIHAQNSEELSSHNAWRTWLEDHVGLLEMVTAGLGGAAANHTILGETFEEVKAVLENTEITEEDFDKASSALLEGLRAFGLAGEDTVHSIDNLALLTREVNSALSNSVFGVKRYKVLRHDRDGTFIPPCTRHVFLKYYTRDEAAAQSYFWSDTDRADYFAAIEESLRDFLKEE
ncbi:DUF262 domain-containing protein [Schaalia sp. Marseille-Q2122]|uniref:DUF262 domain-containing protein n=1 Tax=Schaalia sp. Marseille-Q2122 TaxID=2736604 RepID=UPI00158BC1F0|nr:DUF262 domain-containing protein [Schaalia sp. Marseille-Q2122]